MVRIVSPSVLHTGQSPLPRFCRFNASGELFKPSLEGSSWRNKLCRPSCSPAHTSELPSGDQAGRGSVLLGLWLISRKRCSSALSRSASQISFSPLWLETKAICLPLGDHTGLKSAARLVVS